MNIDNIFRNYSLSTDSYDMPETSYNLIGGKVDSVDDFPSGGFPPIFICQKGKNDSDKQVDVKDDEQIKREYKTHKTSLSIRDLLERRRKTTPFIQV